MKKKLNKKAWVSASLIGNCAKIKEMIEQGFDINYQDDDGHTSLICASYNRFRDIIVFLLTNKDIDITLKDKNGKNFVDWLDNIDILIDIIKDYDLQKRIIENERDDIILYFDEINMIHEKIKEEYPDLFKAKDWGLI
jgi:hypothetical protein